MKSFSIGKFKIGKHLENNDYYRFEILTDTVEIFLSLIILGRVIVCYVMTASRSLKKNYEI